MLASVLDMLRVTSFFMMKSADSGDVLTFRSPHDLSDTNTANFVCV